MSCSTGWRPSEPASRRRIERNRSSSSQRCSPGSKQSRPTPENGTSPAPRCAISLPASSRTSKKCDSLRPQGTLNPCRGLESKHRFEKKLCARPRAWPQRSPKAPRSESVGQARDQRHKRGAADGLNVNEVVLAGQINEFRCESRLDFFVCGNIQEFVHDIARVAGSHICLRLEVVFL